MAPRHRAAGAASGGSPSCSPTITGAPRSTPAADGSGTAAGSWRASRPRRSRLARSRSGPLPDGLGELMRVDDLSVLRRPRAHVAARATVDLARALTVEVLLISSMTGVAELRTLDRFEVEAMLVVVTREAQAPAQRARGRVTDEALASRGGRNEPLVTERDPRRLVVVERAQLTIREVRALES